MTKIVEREIGSLWNSNKSMLSGKNAVNRWRESLRNSDQLKSGLNLNKLVLLKLMVTQLLEPIPKALWMSLSNLVKITKFLR